MQTRYSSCPQAHGQLFINNHFLMFFFSPVSGAFKKLNCLTLNVFADLQLLLLHLEPEKLSVLQ